jgi:hypothetical protein
MAKVREDIGRMAERLAEFTLLQTVRGAFGRPLFRTAPLGDKYPTADFLVDAISVDGTAVGHCFVQVKGTAHASPSAPRITVDVELEDFNRLVRLAIPAYILAVDVRTEEVYLAAACQRRSKAVASVTKAFPLTSEAVKIGFYREVCAFWEEHGVTHRTSRFHDA